MRQLSWNHACKLYRSVKGCSINASRCLCVFAPEMAKKWKEELNAYYVALTTAKKDVFLTANIGPNQNGYQKQTNCLINLQGLVRVDYDWVQIPLKQHADSDRTACCSASCGTE